MTGTRILKSNPKRTVRLEERVEGGKSVLHVVKRFHDPGILERLFDGSRAKAELELLNKLAGRGLPVPRVVGARRVDGRWELSTEYIPDAVNFHELLFGGSAWPLPQTRLLVSLGRLLARVHAAGLDHGDLHGGNVLVDPDGKPWLIDLGKARLLERLSARAMMRDLGQLGSGVREHLSARLRARFLSAYLKALPPELAAHLPQRGPLVRSVEDQARARRQHVNLRGRLRWTRKSGVARPLESEGRNGFVSRALRPPEVEQALLLLAQVQACEPGTVWTGRASWGELGLVGLCAADWSELRRVWYTAARLHDYGIPCARPLCLLRDPVPAAIFALPPGLEPLDRVRVGTHGRARRRLLRSLAALYGRLHDCGLGLEGARPDQVFADADARVYLGVGMMLTDDSLASLRSARKRLLEGMSPLSPRERGLMLRAYLGANRHSREEVLGWERELRSEPLFGD